MATALQKQLQSLRQRPEHEKQLLQSFLFASSDAHQFSRDQIHELAVSGMRELVSLDGRIEAFASALLDPALIRRERSKLVAGEVESVNAAIASLFVYLSPNLHLAAAHKVIEYLVRVYEVHSYNVPELIAAFIPYHDQGLFVRAIALCDLRGTGFEFLKDNQLKGAILPRASLVTACLENPKVLRLVNNAATAAADALVVNHAAFSLWLGVAAEMARLSASGGAAGSGEASFRVLLPTLAGWLSGASTAQLASAGGAGLEIRSTCTNAAAVVLCAWAAEVTFSADVLNVLVSGLVRALRDHRSSGVAAHHLSAVLAHVFNTQPAMDDAAIAGTVRSIVELPWSTALPEDALRYASAASPVMVSALLAHALAARGGTDSAKTGDFIRHVCRTQPLRRVDVDRVIHAALEDFLVLDEEASIANPHNKRQAKRAADRAAAAEIDEAVLDAFHSAQRRFGRLFDESIVAAVDSARSVRVGQSSADASTVTAALFRFVARYLGASGSKYQLMELDASLLSRANDDDGDDDMAAGQHHRQGQLLPIVSCLFHPLPAVRRLVLERALQDAAVAQPSLADTVALVLASEPLEDLALLEVQLLRKCLVGQSLSAETAAEVTDAIADVAASSALGSAAVRDACYHLLGLLLNDSEAVASAAAASNAIASVAAGVTVTAFSEGTAKKAKATAAGVETWFPSACKAAAADANVAGRRGASVAFWSALAKDCAALADGRRAALAATTTLSLRAKHNSVKAKLSRLATSDHGAEGADVFSVLRALVQTLFATEDHRAICIKELCLATERALNEASTQQAAAIVKTAAEPLACLLLALLTAKPGASAAALEAAFVTSTSAANAIRSAPELPRDVCDRLLGAAAKVDGASTSSGSAAVNAALAVVELALASRDPSASCTAAFCLPSGLQGNAVAVKAVAARLKSAANAPAALTAIISARIGHAAFAGADVSEADAKGIVAYGASSTATVACAVLSGLVQLRHGQLAVAALQARITALLASDAAVELSLDEQRLLAVYAAAAASSPGNADILLALIEARHRRVSGAAKSAAVLPSEAVLRAVVDAGAHAAGLFDAKVSASLSSAFTRRLTVALCLRHHDGGSAADPLLVGRAASALGAAVLPHLAEWYAQATGAPVDGGKPAKASRAEKGRSKAAATENVSYEVDRPIGDFAILEFAADVAQAVAANGAADADVATAAERLLLAGLSTCAAPAAAAADAGADDLLLLSAKLRCLTALLRAAALARLDSKTPMPQGVKDALFPATNSPWAALLCADVAVAANATEFAAIALQHASDTPAITAVHIAAEILSVDEDAAGTKPLAAATGLLKRVLPLLASRPAEGDADGEEDDDDDVPTVFTKGKQSKYAKQATAKPRLVAAAPAGGKEVAAELLPITLLALLVKLAPMATDTAAARGTAAKNFKSPEAVIAEVLLGFPVQDTLLCLGGMADVFVRSGLLTKPSAKVQVGKHCPKVLSDLIVQESRAVAESLPAVLACMKIVTEHQSFIEAFVRANASLTKTLSAGHRAASAAKRLAGSSRVGASKTALAALADMPPFTETDGTADGEDQSATVGGSVATKNAADAEVFLDVVVSFLQLYAAAQGTEHEPPCAAMLGRLLTMVDEPTFLLVVRNLIAAGDERASPRGIRLRGYEILFDRLVVSSDRRAAAGTASLVHAAVDQLGGSVELTALSAGILHDLSAACERLRAGDLTANAVELQWIATTWEEVLRLVGVHAAGPRTAEPLGKLCVAFPAVLERLAAADGAVLGKDEAALACAVVTSLGAVSQSLGFGLMIPHAPAFLEAALAVLEYASTPAVMQAPDAAHLKALRRRSVGALLSMLPATWTMSSPVLPRLVQLVTQRIVVDDAECRDSAKSILNELAALLEPRVFFPAVSSALAVASPARHSIGTLFESIDAVVQRMSRAELKGMSDVMDATLFTVAFESLARQPRLPSDVTTQPIHRTFLSVLVKFKEGACIALTEHIISWAMTRRPSDTAAAARRDVHRWTLAAALLLHVTSHLAAVGVFLYPALASMITEIIQTYCSGLSDAGSSGARKQLRTEQRSDEDDEDDSAAASRGHRANGVQPYVTECLDVVFPLVGAMANGVQASTVEALGDASTAPADLIPYFARQDVFAAWAPALTKQLGNSRYLTDDRASYAERVAGKLAPALRRWFASLRSPKLWSRAQAHLVAMLRSQEARVRRAVLQTLRGVYEDGGQELAALMLAEALPQIVEATEDSSDEVVEEARLFCDFLSKLTGQDVLTSMMA
jgi:hypothetical protein